MAVSLIGTIYCLSSETVDGLKAREFYAVAIEGSRKSLEQIARFAL